MKLLSNPMPGRHRHWRAYAGATALCLGLALLALPLAALLDGASLVLFFLLAVVVAAAAFGRGENLPVQGEA